MAKVMKDKSYAPYGRWPSGRKKAAPLKLDLLPFRMKPHVELALDRWAEDFNENYAEFLAMRALAKAMAVNDKEVQ